jgi:hypothetical protein
VSDVERYETLLFERFQSPVIGGGDLRRLLGYRTGAAFRQAAHRRRLPIPTFFIEGRRGRFARTGDVAAYFAALLARLPHPPDLTALIDRAALPAAREVPTGR